MKSYSQEGEDLILRRIFSNKKDGFYIDVGAHHPKRFSNTYALYKLGWKGINIEPNPETFNLFEKLRSRDINLNFGVALNAGKLNYYMFDEAALNTFDSKIFYSRISETIYKHKKTIIVDVKPLTEILKLNISKDRKIDFLSVDVEGLDLEVLKSNDWNVFRPDWVLVEQLNMQDIENLSFEIHHYLKTRDYVLFAKTLNTLFYKNKNVIL
ncbi:FkbM family methyltransferase [Candidatus Methylopumilus universalis]|nr:FkbM family methyltransferase [Candidatus Methylopumilus universalis]QDC72575.1 FkbM family methyltransferase [Candidatus Methylopumilus universalis]